MGLRGTITALPDLGFDRHSPTKWNNFIRNAWVPKKCQRWHCTPGHFRDPNLVETAYYLAALESAQMMMDERQQRRYNAGLPPFPLTNKGCEVIIDGEYSCPNDLRPYKRKWYAEPKWNPYPDTPVLQTDFILSVDQLVNDQYAKYKGEEPVKLLTPDGIPVFTPDMIRQREIERELLERQRLDRMILAELYAQGADLETIKAISDITSTDPLAQEALELLEDVVFETPPVASTPTPFEATKPVPSMPAPNPPVIEALPPVLEEPATITSQHGMINYDPNDGLQSVFNRPTPSTPTATEAAPGQAPRAGAALPLALAGGAALLFFMNR